MKKALGVDIGGTKIAAAIIYEDGTYKHRIDEQTTIDSAEALYETLLAVINHVMVLSGETWQTLAGIGLGVPGKVNAKVGIAVYQNNIPWTNFPLVERLQQDFPDVAVKIDNDVKVAAYAEYRLLSLEAEDMFGYVTVSTGIACTNIWNNQILRGSGFSGEIGFVPVPSSTGLRAVEKVAAGPAIAQAARDLYRESTMTTADVFDRWEQCEWQAAQIIEQSALGVSLSIYSMICLLDPRAIVLGGSVVLHNPKYVDLIKTQLQKMMHEEQLHVLEHIQASHLDGHNGIIGAGFLVM
ncbi:ROK family protein [Tuanshanicoccus lijuaniae]|uniref:ROK family protein n=1 Tax=Aerococcaceae bacterium zg-1292 TaxID=2774330 RepID=UPI0019366DF2|nr:ROK family protein [Aerococcaceae bacterium zg-1292]MBF6626594.1 ROK family protein [Aerococcaceae bacterium zg-BR9]QQA36908.1 ROK family protein [Aerococcaceae bacterium zg-1292]